MVNRFEDFTVSILKLNKLIQKIKQHEMKSFGLKAIHVMCIHHLFVSGRELTASDLSRLTLEDKAAISRALLLLREKGFVHYDPNGYHEPIKLTEAGERVAESIGEKAQRAVAAGSAQITEEEREFFYRSLGAITENLEKYYEELKNE